MTQRTSLRRKLFLISGIGSVVVAMIAGGAFTYWDLSRFWNQTTEDVAALASVVGDQVGPAVLLNDTKAASEILASLRTDNRVRDAWLYASDGTCFAAFHSEPIQLCPSVPRDGIRREIGSIEVTRPVVAGQERIGTIELTARLPTLASVLVQYGRGAALIVVLKLLMAAVLAIILQYHVTGPILAIAKMAREMADNFDFRERVPVNSSDEVGVLASSFNTMVEEIVRRDSELERQHRRLEQEIRERSLMNQELRQAKDKAEEAARLKSEFLANMSHEIRTPLNGVTGMITLALDHCVAAEEREQLEAAKSAAMSLTAILNDILDLSRIEAGKLNIDSVAFDLSSALRESLRIFDLAVAEKSLYLHIDISPDCPARVLGDPVRLRQVLINLVGNAVKFTLEGGIAVQVSAPRPGLVRLDVRDTGIGIPRDKLEVIFEAFTQADGSHTRRFGGSGLGLTITKRLVMLMGGRIVAESEPGNGSVFSVEVPLPPAPALASPAETRAPPGTTRLGKLRVLVAEDNPVNQKVVEGILRRQGCSVVLAATGRQAFDAYLEQRFDLILMDVQMPEVDGLEASRLIRAEEQRRSLERTPIVAVTAHASSSQHEQCRACGMDAVVTKPIDLALLLKTIQDVLPVPSAPAA